MLCAAQHRRNPIACPLRSLCGHCLRCHVPLSLSWLVSWLHCGSPLTWTPLVGIVVWQVRTHGHSTPVSKFSQLAFGQTMVAFAVVSDLSQNEQGMDVSRRERCTLQSCETFKDLSVPAHWACHGFCPLTLPLFLHSWEPQDLRRWDLLAECLLSLQATLRPPR